MDDTRLRATIAAADAATRKANCEHPFVVGARVAVAQGYLRGYAEDRVAKVHKSGRFTLVNSRHAGQWRPRPSADRDGSWAASRAGQNNGSLLFWDDAAEPAIQRVNAARDRVELRNAIQYRLKRLSSDVTNERLQAIKDILDCAEEKK